MYLLPTDSAAAAEIAAFFGPDAFIELKKQPLNLDAFQTFVKGYRDTYKFLDFKFEAPVVSADEGGQGGTVGFAMRDTAERKRDGRDVRASLV